MASLSNDGTENGEGKRRVKGTLIVDVVSEFAATNRLDELREFVEKQEIFAVLEGRTITELKRFLRSQVPADANAFAAARSAERSDEPCQPG
ncbi:hypothetical protein [Labrenzia sp. PHM005]|uniref:hypothetical protein n=1 Tax=Labrenzia sp. PHM005 TaxID=2590016 RepID=UPI00113FFB82|nr:hypothetical protein [Labrenzia sp. PHM005]QDG78655.1 hypothetical protein FJ695_23855 [Labrenzia sp. PHM005]